MPLLGAQAAAHVDPAVRHPGVIEVFGDDRRRDQLAEGHDRIVPQLRIAGIVALAGRHALQLAEEPLDRLQPFGAVPQFVDDRGMVLAQRGDLVPGRLRIVPLHGTEHAFQRIGRLSHRRNDDEEVLFVVDDLAQVPHAVGIADRSAAEFIYFHDL